MLLSGSMGKGKKRVLKIVDDNETTTEVPIPESFAGLVESLAEQFDVPEDQILCYDPATGPQEPITNSDDLAELVAASPAELRVSVLMSLSEYGEVSDRSEEENSQSDVSEPSERQKKQPKGRKLSSASSSEQSGKHPAELSDDQTDSVNESRTSQSEENKTESEQSTSHVSLWEGDESKVTPTGPFVVRAWQGYLKYWDLSSGEVLRQSLASCDMHSRVCVVDETVYVSGGISKPTLFCQFSLKTRKLTYLRNLPRGRYNHAMVTHNDEVTVLAGISGRQTTHCMAFDGEWNDLPPLVYSRHGHSAVSSGTDLYVVGGVDRGSVEVLREGEDAWETLELRIELTHAGLCFLEDQDLLIVGGAARKKLARAYSLQIDSEEETEMEPLPYADTFVSLGVQVEESVYFLGTLHCYVLDLETGVWQLGDV